MANTEPCRAVSLELNEKIYGINKTTELRRHFNYGKKSNNQLAEFIKTMRDPTYNREQNNKKLLHSIFHLAGFDESRYDVKFNELTLEEERSLVLVLNQIKGMVTILPNKLVLPELPPH
ncbi:Phage-related protein [Xenorhabdus mauleonii]|uniref:Phage-related protein n=1 Tax=Xenorhabdus mauleonii TaxID=351675 RepID=A0A1I3XJH0_9GAMM|nr:DUF5347 family protein [Xenorhabdus mauleonii]PHM36187.1 Phage-related protein [Xenorhabdus mauleonii]SFK19206.1 hypothetical protein SAMN05421680_13525 [Xenorhabdus mauleonii]